MRITNAQFKNMMLMLTEACIDTNNAVNKLGGYNKTLKKGHCETLRLQLKEIEQMSKCLRTRVDKHVNK